MGILNIYHGTNEDFVRPDWEEVIGENGWSLYGTGFYGTDSIEEASRWGENIHHYTLETEGLKVLEIKEHGRELYQLIQSLVIREDYEYDVVIIPNDNIKGYADDLFNIIVMGDGTEEEVNEMCSLLEKGISETRMDDNGKPIKYDINSDKTKQIIILNEETLNKMNRV